MNLIRSTINLLDPDLIERVEIEEDKVVMFMKKSIDLERFNDTLEEIAKRDTETQKKYHLKTRDEILRQARTRARDSRIIAILEKYPNMTFREWVKWQYPDVNPQRVYDMLHKYKDLTVRECIARIGVRKK